MKPNRFPSPCDPTRVARSTGLIFVFALGVAEIAYCPPTPSSSARSSRASSDMSISSGGSNRGSGSYGNISNVRPPSGVYDTVPQGPYDRVPDSSDYAPVPRHLLRTSSSSPRNSASSSSSSGDYGSIPGGSSPSSEYMKAPPPQSYRGTPNPSPRNSLSEPQNPSGSSSSSTSSAPGNILGLPTGPSLQARQIKSPASGSRAMASDPGEADTINAPLPQVPKPGMLTRFKNLVTPTPREPNPGPLPESPDEQVLRQPLPRTPLVPGPNVTIVRSPADSTVIARGENVLPPTPPRRGPQIVRSPKDLTPVELDDPNPGPLPPLPNPLKLIPKVFGGDADAPPSDPLPEPPGQN